MPNRLRGRRDQLGTGGHSWNEVFLRYMIYINILWIASHILDETIGLHAFLPKRSAVLREKIPGRSIFSILPIRRHLRATLLNIPPVAISAGLTERGY